MLKQFDALASTINTLSSGKPVIYMANPGNWGDALIRAGTLAFFTKYEIPFIEIKLKEDSFLRRNLLFLKAKLTGQLVIAGGGGAWCEHYPQFANTITNLQHKFNFSKLIVLPSTYDKKYDISNVLFYRRDEFESKQAMPNSVFCHDMAFCLVGSYQAQQAIEESLNAFRTDIEANGDITLSTDNLDLSSKGNELKDVTPFFAELNKYHTINTDRLHVCIAGSILGKVVNLHAGSYFKNEAIFKSSIKGKFNNTNFISP